MTQPQVLTFHLPINEEKETVPKPQRIYVNPWFNKPGNLAIGLQRSRESYRRRRDEILLKRKEKIDCACGGIYTIDHKSHHNRTKRHQNAVAEAKKLADEIENKYNRIKKLLTN